MPAVVFFSRRQVSILKGLRLTSAASCSEPITTVHPLLSWQVEGWMCWPWLHGAVVQQAMMGESLTRVTSRLYLSCLDVIKCMKQRTAWPGLLNVDCRKASFKKFRFPCPYQRLDFIACQQGNAYLLLLLIKLRKAVGREDQNLKWKSSIMKKEGQNQKLKMCFM